jgi:hypothetical protein
VRTGADYKYLRAYEGVVEWSAADLGLSDKPLERDGVLRELRALVATYLEGSDDAPRAAELLDALEPPAVHPAPASQPRDPAQEDRERRMFGCTVAIIDEALEGKVPRDLAMYAMSVLSDAQELIARGDVSVSDANTARQLMNVAKHAINQAVPR